MDKIIGGFIRSQLILSLIVMILTFIVLIVFKIKYPIIIAFINGVANIIPYFGPILGLFPALIAALSESGSKAVMIAIVFIIVQEIESSVIAPKVMGESIGMHPVFVMIVLLIGGKYFGATGLIFSIPVGGIIKVSWSYLVRSMY
jgi:predicted PurR-regulated permease PerM